MADKEFPQGPQNPTTPEGSTLPSSTPQEGRGVLYPTGSPSPGEQPIVPKVPESWVRVTPSKPPSLEESQEIGAGSQDEALEKAGEAAVGDLPTRLIPPDDFRTPPEDPNRDADGANGNPDPDAIGGISPRETAAPKIERPTIAEVQQREAAMQEALMASAHELANKNPQERIAALEKLAEALAQAWHVEEAVGVLLKIQDARSALEAQGSTSRAQHYRL